MKLFAIALLAGLAAQPLHAEIAAKWVQMMPGDYAQARVATDGACPTIRIDGKTHRMSERAAADKAFPLRICAAPVRIGSKSVSVEGTALPVPKAEVDRIVVIGDTGCRIKNATIQDCNDPEKWPFPLVAQAAAKLHPDLVIHVGDYLYRETPCPHGNSDCAGSPSGDRWASWNADFFAPASPLLAAAPFVIVRGNHEDCSRAGPGWLRLLGPLHWSAKAPCNKHLWPYAVPIGGIDLVVMDDANAPDISIAGDLVPEYKRDFASLAGIAHKPLWLVLHRPVWGAVKLLGMGVGGNRTLIAALGNAHALDNVDLMLSGHIHAFEALNYGNGAPPQIVAGNSGDLLDAAPADLSGLSLSGEPVKDGMSLPGFGFLSMQRDGDAWKIDLYRVDGSVQGHCTFADRRVDCTKS